MSTPTSSDLSVDRQQAHAYLDHLPPGQLRAVRELLRSMLTADDLKLVEIPIEDEEIGPEEEESVRQSIEWLKRNTPIPMQEIVADLGFTMQHIEDPKLNNSSR